MTNIRSRNVEYHKRIARAAKAVRQHSFRTFYFIEYAPPKPETPLPPGERWVLDVLAVPSAEGEEPRTAYHGAWRSTADPRDRGNVPGNPTNPIIVLWDETSPEEAAPTDQSITG